LTRLHDIDQIADFIANYNQQPLNAVKVSEAIFETINKIAQNPFAFRDIQNKNLPAGSMFVLDDHL